MIYLVLIASGGLINFFKVYNMLQGDSDEEAPYKFQGYVSGFVMGCIFNGLPLAFFYWLFFVWKVMNYAAFTIAYLVAGLGFYAIHSTKPPWQQVPVWRNPFACASVWPVTLIVSPFGMVLSSVRYLMQRSYMLY